MNKRQEKELKNVEYLSSKLFPEIKKNLKNVPFIKLYYESNIEPLEMSNFVKISHEKVRKDKVVEESIFIKNDDIEKLFVAIVEIEKYRVQKKEKKNEKKIDQKKLKEKKFNKVYDNSDFPKSKRKDAYKYFVLNDLMYVKDIKHVNIEKYINEKSDIEARDYTKKLKKEISEYLKNQSVDEWVLGDYSLQRKVSIRFKDRDYERYVEVFSFQKNEIRKIKSMFLPDEVEKILAFVERENLENAVSVEKDYIISAYNHVNKLVKIDSERKNGAFVLSLGKYHYDDVFDDFLFHLFVSYFDEINVFSENQKRLFFLRKKFRNKLKVDIQGVVFNLAVFLKYDLFRKEFLNFILSDSGDINVFLKNLNDSLVVKKINMYERLIYEYIYVTIIDVMNYSQRNYDFKRLSVLSSDEINELFFKDFARIFSKKINEDPDNLKREFRLSFLDDVKESVYDDLKGVVKNYLIKELIKIDYKESFPLARKMKRKFKFFMGETNSGKTYQAFNELVKAKSGLYLSPLRLLALEGQEEIEKRGHKCSMLTGEESDIKDGATFKSSTIEMLNIHEYVESVVIDEIQMIKDPNRGWAWVQAMVGCAAENVILAGSSEVLEVVKRIVEYTGDELEIVSFKRKSPLIVMDNPIKLSDVKSGTAIIAFSRRKVLELKDLLKNRSVSVIYGNLGPEVRKEEARKFRDGETEILIATDAIAMGLNLPIETIIFSTHEKNIRGEKFEIDPQLVMQIAGRAGRYGIKNKGFVGSLNHATLKYVKSIMGKKIDPYDGRVPIMPNLDYLEKIQGIIKTESLSKILMAFEKYADFNSELFYCTDLERRIELAEIIDDYGFSLSEGFMLSSAPVRENYDGGVDYFEMYIKFLFDVFYGENERMVRSPSIDKFLSIDKTKNSELLKEAEELMHNLDLYNWFSNRYMNMFFEYDLVLEKKSILNDFIINSLKKH